MQQPPPIGAFPPGTKLTVGSHAVVIKSYISEGGFAHVYVVYISPASQEGEIACLKRVVVPDKIHLNLLRAEVDAMKRLKGHPNIVRYIDSHAARMNTGQGYEVLLLMEYCSGNGLIDFMNSRLREQLTESEILKIMADITSGLACMHYLQPPLIHRDLKIENVLISGDGTYKLCDFGSVSPILRPPRNTTEFHILEDDIQRHTTAQYRSPEMVDIYRGFPINEKCDIWALGVFLYKLCYYTTPFEREGQLAILHASFSFPARPQYSDRLKRVITALLAEDPRNRPNVYQVFKEICAMRGVEVPIKDIYSKVTEESRYEEVQSAPPENNGRAVVQETIPPIDKQPPVQVAHGLVKATAQPVKKDIPEIQPMYRGRPQVKLVKPQVSPSGAAVFDDPFANLDKKTVKAKESLKAKESERPQRESPEPPEMRPPTITTTLYDEQDIQTRFPSVEELSKSLEMQRLDFDPSSDEDNPYARPYEKPKLFNKSTLSLSSSSSGSLAEVPISVDKRKPLPPLPARPKPRAESPGLTPRPRNNGHHPRPVSMYQTSESNLIGGVPVEDREQLKKILTGLSQRTNTVILDSDNHIDSNLDFLKTLDKENTGRPHITSSRTGDRYYNIRRSASAASSKHTKKSSISSIKGMFRKPDSPALREPQNGDMGPPRAVSRGGPDRSEKPPSGGESSWNERVKSPSNETRKPYRNSRFSLSSEEFLPADDPEEKKRFWNKSKAVTRSSTIQSRMQQLLERDNSPPRKTASGYGKYTDANLPPPSKTAPPTGPTSRNHTNDSTKPNAKEVHSNPHDDYRVTSPTFHSPKPHSYRSMGVLRDGYVPQSSNHSRKLSAVSCESSSSGGSKRPPVKPAKPAHLQSPKRQNATWTGPRDSLKTRERAVDIEDDWEKQFNLKYPSLG